MKLRKEKKPRPSNIGRRTGVDVVEGKKIRRQDDGTDVFEDYWTDNESIGSNHTTQSIQSPVKSRSEKRLENVSILDKDSVSYSNAPRSSMKRSQRSGENEDHYDYSRSEHLKRSDVSGKENHLEIGRRTGGVVIQGKKIRKQRDGTDVYDDYWTDYDSKQISQSLCSSNETRSKRISENVSVSNRDSVGIMQTTKTDMKESLSRGSGKFQDQDGYSSPEQSKRSRVSRGKSQLPLETMQTSDLMENRQVLNTADSHIENSAIGRSKMTQTSHLLDEIESPPSKNSMHLHHKSRKSNRADLSDGKINSSVENYSTERPLRTSERNTMQTPDLLKNRQETESISSKNRMNLHNKSRKSSVADLSYGGANSSVQKYPSEKSQRTSENSTMETPDQLENSQASSSVDLDVKTDSQDALQENLSSSKSLRRSSRYKKPPASPLQNKQLKFVNVFAEKEYEFVEDHDDSTPEILVSRSKRSGVSREKSHFFEDVENSAIARSKVTQTSHLLDEIENIASKNRMHNKSRKSNEADLSDGKINSSLQKYSIEKSQKKSERSTMRTPDLLENRQEIESIPSRSEMQMHNKSRKSSLSNLSYENVNSSVQKYLTEKSQRKSERSTIQTPGLLENRQEIESIPSRSEMQNHNQSRKSSMEDLSNENSSVRNSPTEKSQRTSESSTMENPDLLENSQASSTADSHAKTAPQDVLQENASSPDKGFRRSSRYKIQPLASWRNERLKFVKVSATKEYECVGVEGGQPEDDYALKVLKKRFESKVKKRKIAPFNKKRKNIPKNIKKTPVFDKNTEKIIELYLHRPFSSYEWTTPPNEPGIMISRAFQSMLINFGFLDIAGHSMKGKQVSLLDNLYFVVIKGCVKVEINTTSFDFQKGDSFIVPCGTFYCMNNETSTNALLSYCSFRLPFFKFQEKD